MYIYVYNVIFIQNLQLCISKLIRSFTQDLEAPAAKLPLSIEPYELTVAFSVVNPTPSVLSRSNVSRVQCMFMQFPDPLFDTNSALFNQGLLSTVIFV